MMNLIFSTVFAILLISTEASVVGKNPVSPVSRGLVSISKINGLQKTIKDAGGCQTNVCFAIDGSGSIPAQGFTNELNFVLDVASVLTDNPVSLGAVQYATSVDTISVLTDNDEDFILAVDGTKQAGGRSFVVGGINACFSQLFPKRGQPIKIVLLGDGRSNIGGDAVARADLFRSIGGDVCAVGAGFADVKELLAIAGGDKDKVFEVDDFLDVLDMEAIFDDLVLGICDIQK